jgi:hypothetical protein
MEKVHAANFVDVEVILDGKHYINCLFTRCVFVYNGGESDIEEPLKMQDCSLRLGGAASRTAEVLRRFGFIQHFPIPLDVKE